MRNSLQRKAAAPLVLAAASTFCLMFAATQASAQDYGGTYGRGEPQYDRGGYRDVPEQVIVTAPYYYAPQRGHLGGDIKTISMSREVRVDDLDLSTRWGVHELRSRIHYTARAICERLDRLYPVAADNSPSCYRTAIDRANYQVSAAIRDAREDEERE